MCVWVAECDGVPCGMVGLDASDMADRPHLGPWLASLYVVPEHRGRGVASALVDHVLSRTPGTLYLWCYPALVRFYERKGFTVLEHRHDGRIVLASSQSRC